MKDADKYALDAAQKKDFNYQNDPMIFGFLVQAKVDKLKELDKMEESRSIIKENIQKKLKMSYVS